MLLLLCVVAVLAGLTHVGDGVLVVNAIHVIIIVCCVCACSCRCSC